MSCLTSRPTTVNSRLFFSRTSPVQGYVASEVHSVLLQRPQAQRWSCRYPRVTEALTGMRKVSVLCIGVRQWQRRRVHRVEKQLAPSDFAPKFSSWTDSCGTAQYRQRTRTRQLPVSRNRWWIGPKPAAAHFASRIVCLGESSSSKLGATRAASVPALGPDPILQASASEIVEKVQTGTWTAMQVVERYLQRLQETEPHIHAYINVDEQFAREQAALIDQKRERGEALGLVAGVPISIKDNLLTRALPTTAGSLLLENYQPAEDATCVRRLREQGAIILGKTALDEFGMGSSSENCAFGVVRNPRDLTRVPGGSSGGSAASVAASSALVSLGSDTGGSIRQPAAFCGVVGLKPSYGRVSRYGLIAYASSLDTVGPIGRSVEDITRCLAVIAGPDPHDLTTLADTGISLDALPDIEEALVEERKPLANIRLGVWTEALEMPQLASEARLALQEAIATFSSLGASVVPVSMPSFQAACAAYYILASSEASANLARYDGVRYGVRQDGARTAAEMTRRVRTRGFGPEVKRRIMLGTFALSAGYVDAYYRRAMQVRRLVTDDFWRAFQHCDFLLSPVSPTGAFALGAKAGIDLYAEDVLTVPASLAGLPALTLPANPSARLPTGMQLIGRFGDDVGVLRLGRLYERVAGAASLANAT
jgi:aspartyl-tRNA(Asn)/glutamyl-tRNA(Gln) amidotransferase subunit A